MHGKFREDSQEALDLVCSASTFDTTKHYETNTGETVPIMSPHDAANF